MFGDLFLLSLRSGLRSVLMISWMLLLFAMRYWLKIGLSMGPPLNIYFRWSSSFLINSFYCISLCQLTSHLNLSVKITFLSISSRFISYFSSWYFFLSELFSLLIVFIVSTCRFKWSFYFLSKSISYCIFLLVGSMLPNNLSAVS